MFTFGIVDDEYEYLHIISDCIVDCIGNNHDIYRFKSGKDLIKSNLIFDLVFLDIGLETEDGIEVAKKLDYITSGIIFITSHQEKVFDAFNKNVYKFVLKNNLKDFFQHDFLEIMHKMNYDIVEIYHNKEIDKVRFDNIILVEYKNRNTEIVTVTNIFKLSKTPLKNFVNKLNNDFIEVNRHVYVNYKYIDHINKNNGILIEKLNKYIPVPKHRYDKVIKEYIKRKFRI